MRAEGEAEMAGRDVGFEAVKEEKEEELEIEDEELDLVEEMEL